jgi:hypothetical protein
MGVCVSGNSVQKRLTYQSLGSRSSKNFGRLYENCTFFIFILWSEYWNVKEGKIIPVTDRGSPQVFETSRLPHYLDNRLTNDCEVVSLTRRPPFTPQEDSWYSFLLEAESTPGP